jgi:hypothetical protein
MLGWLFWSDMREWMKILNKSSADFWAGSEEPHAKFLDLINRTIFKSFDTAAAATAKKNSILWFVGD